MIEDPKVSSRTANVILLFLILFLLGLGTYVVYNVQEVKALQDPYDYCSQFGYYKLDKYAGIDYG